MLFKSKNIALIVASFVSGVTLLTLFIAPDTQPIAFFIVFGASFSSTYIITYIIFEFILFKELKSFYNKLGKIDNKNYNLEDLDSFNLKQMSDEIFKFTSKKEDEIKKLKKVEAFRREFLADISHELKTPIFAAQGFIETLIDGAVDDPKVRDKFLLKASKALDNLDIIVKDLIAISQLETGEFKLDIENYDLAHLAKEQMDQLEQKAEEKDIKLALITLGNGPYKSPIDCFRIGQVFLNLINNGINYAGAGSTVTVTIQDLDKENWQISVSDNGIGIPEEHLPKLFSRFYRVDKSRSRDTGGSGLGLSIVKSIVEAHQSVIFVESSVGNGAKFYFKLKKSK